MERAGARPRGAVRVRLNAATYLTGSSSVAELAIYCGSATTAHLIIKILAGNGTVLNAAGDPYFLPVTPPPRLAIKTSVTI